MAGVSRRVPFMRAVRREGVRAAVGQRSWDAQVTRPFRSRPGSADCALLRLARGARRSPRTASLLPRLDLLAPELFPDAACVRIARVQRLYVIGGEGTAVVDGQPHPLRPGVLLLVERGEAHEIRNTGDEPLRTLDLYVPPAYTEAGDTLPAGQG